MTAALVNTSRLAALSDFIGPLGFNGWAVLTDRGLATRSQAVPVGRWTRHVEERLIYDTATLIWTLDADLVYDAWALVVSADAAPFISFPLPGGIARRGDTIEIEARIIHYGAD